MITRYKIRNHLGDKLELWVDPRKVECSVNPSTPPIKHAIWAIEDMASSIPMGKSLLHLPRAALYAAAKHVFDTFVISQTSYGEPMPIRGSPLYDKIDDAVKNMDRIEHSIWYQQLYRDLLDTGFARHKKIRLQSKEDIAVFFRE